MIECVYIVHAYISISFCDWSEQAGGVFIPDIPLATIHYIYTMAILDR